MPASPTVTESRDLRNRERLKAIILSVVDEEIAQCERMQGELDELNRKHPNWLLTPQVKIWSDRLSVLRWFRRRFTPRTKRYVPKELRHGTEAPAADGSNPDPDRAGKPAAD